MKVFRKIQARRPARGEGPVSHATFLLAVGSYLCELHKAVVTLPELSPEQQVALQPVVEEYAVLEAVFTRFVHHTQGGPRR